ncbi:MAG: membrane-bound lytic murein transglycosylase F [Candidatus Krumholzibacteriia bacterium]
MKKSLRTLALYFSTARYGLAAACCLLIAVVCGCQEPIDDGSLTSRDGVPAIAHPLIARDFEQLKSSGVLRVISNYNSSTYFVHKGGQAGFDFELIDRFAQKHGLHVEVVVPEHNEDPISMLNSGQGDVICRGQASQPGIEKWVMATRPTNFVQKLVVLPIDSPREPDIASLAGLTLTVAAEDDFRTELLELKAKNRWQIFVSAGRPGADPEELLTQLANHELEAVVVDDIVAKTAMMNLDNLKLGTTLGERKATAWYVRQNSPVLQAELNKYLRQHFWVGNDGRSRRSQTYGIIYDRYFENPTSVRDFREVALRPDKSGAISVFDDLIRHHAEAAGFDWRLIAAQTYQESRFNPHARSRADARGLMQILPQFAGAQRDSLYYPDANMRAGIRLLTTIWSTYAYLDSLDRTRFTLAEYHAGAGHIADARRLAMEMGRDPNQWQGALTVSLPRLMQRKHFETTRYGYYGGEKTVKYVEDILNRYRVYQYLVPRYPETDSKIAPALYSRDFETDLSAIPELIVPPELE